MRTGRSLAGFVSVIYLVLVAGFWGWAYLQEQEASLGFMLPYLVTLPLSLLLVQVLPGYVALAVAGLVQAGLLYVIASWLAGRFREQKLHGDKP